MRDRRLVGATTLPCGRVDRGEGPFGVLETKSGERDVGGHELAGVAEIGGDLHGPGLLDRSERGVEVAGDGETPAELDERGGALAGPRRRLDRIPACALGGDIFLDTDARASEATPEADGDDGIGSRGERRKRAVGGDVVFAIRKRFVDSLDERDLPPPNGAYAKCDGDRADEDEKQCHPVRRHPVQADMPSAPAKIPK